MCLKQNKKNIQSRSRNIYILFKPLLEFLKLQDPDLLQVLRYIFPYYSTCDWHLSWYSDQVIRPESKLILASF